MSFQRIIDAARRLGTPIIVSDVAGREPMVLLPLDLFEALSSGPSTPVVEDQNMGGDEPTIEPTPGSNELPFKNTPPAPDMPKASASDQIPSNLEDDLSLEERFYLEPLEENPS